MITKNNVRTQSFKDLVIWQKAHCLTLAIYAFTKDFPSEEKYGLAAQMRRAAVSVPANIAEGYKKSGKLDKVRYLNIAQGSLEETHYYLILARDLGYGDTAMLIDKYNEVARLLNAYMKAILADHASK